MFAAGPQRQTPRQTFVDIGNFPPDTLPGVPYPCAVPVEKCTDPLIAGMPRNDDFHTLPGRDADLQSFGPRTAAPYVAAVLAMR